jgi:hypothetical protein
MTKAQKALYAEAKNAPVRLNTVVKKTMAERLAANGFGRVYENTDPSRGSYGHYYTATPL